MMDEGGSVINGEGDCTINEQGTTINEGKMRCVINEGVGM